MPKRLASLFSLLLVAAAGPAPRVESFSPEALAKGVRQVAVPFSQPMIAFGDPGARDARAPAARGRHELVLHDETGRPIDTVRFVVR